MTHTRAACVPRSSYSCEFFLRISQVNAKFESTEQAVAQSCLRLANDLNSATFLLAGILAVSYEITVSVVSMIIAASGFLSSRANAAIPAK